MTTFYWLVPRDNLVGNSFVADRCDLKGFEENDFYRGDAIKSWPSAVTFRASTAKLDGDLDDFVVNNAMVPLITMRLLKFIQGLSTLHFQALPARAVSSSGNEIPVFVLNFTELPEGLDLARTVVDRYPDNWSDESRRGKIWTVRRRVLVRNRVEMLDFFRVKEYPEDLFASERFRSGFESARMTGVSFDRVRLS